MMIITYSRALCRGSGAKQRSGGDYAKQRLFLVTFEITP